MRLDDLDLTAWARDHEVELALLTGALEGIVKAFAPEPEPDPLVVLLGEFPLLPSDEYEGDGDTHVDTQQP